MLVDPAGRSLWLLMPANTASSMKTYKSFCIGSTSWKQIYRSCTIFYMQYSCNHLRFSKVVTVWSTNRAKRLLGGSFHSGFCFGLHCDTSEGFHTSGRIQTKSSQQNKHVRKCWQNSWEICKMSHRFYSYALSYLLFDCAQQGSQFTSLTNHSQRCEKEIKVPELLSASPLWHHVCSAEYRCPQHCTSGWSLFQHSNFLQNRVSCSCVWIFRKRKVSSSRRRLWLWS